MKIKLILAFVLMAGCLIATGVAKAQCSGCWYGYVYFGGPSGYVYQSCAGNEVALPLYFAEVCPDPSARGGVDYYLMAQVVGCDKYGQYCSYSVVNGTVVAKFCSLYNCRCLYAGDPGP
jgi:hypothetical protein